MPPLLLLWLVVCGVCRWSPHHVAGVGAVDTNASSLSVAPPFALRSVPGWFIQSSSAQQQTAPSPPRMGLLDGKTWADVYAAIEAFPQAGKPKPKLIVFLRHGQGTHNVAIDRYGSDAWNNYLRKMAIYTDAPLTPLGVRQAHTASSVLAKQLEDGLQVDQVVVSPLDRALATFVSAFRELPKVPHIVKERARETLGMYTCDKRRTVREKKKEFPSVHFDPQLSDGDVLWKETYRETDTEIDVRAAAFLQALFTGEKARTIAVVTHSLFTNACLRVLGHRAYPLGTGEFLPLLIHDASP